MSDFQDERWLPVVGYEGYYEVSDMGRIRSLDRTIRRSDGVLVRRLGKIRKPQVVLGDFGGHLVVELSRGGQKFEQGVHRFVLEAFVGLAPPGMEGCHNNGDPADNRLENLRWDTRRNNALDMTKHGKNVWALKTHCPRGHPYDEENTYRSPSNPRSRGCRICRKAKDDARNARVSAERAEAKRLSALRANSVQ